MNIADEIEIKTTKIYNKQIEKGEEILEKIKEIALAENIKLANVNALGATCEMVIDMIDGSVDRYFDEKIGLNVFQF